MKSMKRLSMIVPLLVLAVCGAGVVKGDVITFVTPVGSTASGQPVDALVTFTTSTDHIHIALVNNEANPITVAQNLSDLGFGITTGQSAGSLLTSAGRERTVSGTAPHPYTDGSLVSTGWALETPGATTPFRLHVLGTAIGPAHTIIGPPDGSGNYSAAGGSIGGNSAHNPFLAGIVSFDLDVPWVTGASSIDRVFFSFGTGVPEPIVGGTLPPPPQGPDAVPEPSTLALAVVGLMAAFWGFRVRRQLAKA